MRGRLRTTKPSPRRRATAAFGLAILGGTRALHLGREGRAGEATLFGLLGALGPVLVSLCVLTFIAGAFARRLQRGPALTAEA